MAWTASTGTPAPTGYYIARVTGATSMPACGTSPAAPVTGTSCTDSSVPEGTHHYIATAVHRAWTAVSAASGSVTVDNINTINFMVQPAASAAAGSPIQSVTVELRTGLGIKLLMPGVQVTIGTGNNPAGGTLAGTLTATTNIRGEATFTGLSITKAGTGYTLMATSPGYSGAVSTAFAVTAAAASKLTITNPSLAGTASANATSMAITVERQDTYGNPVTTGSTTVTLASNSAGTKVFAASAAGTTTATVAIPAGSAAATFFYGDTKAGAPTITVRTAGLAPASKQVTISPAAEFKLAFGLTPLAPTKNQLITPGVPISILDPYGNLTASTAVVSVASACNLHGTLAVTAAGGVATFTNLTFNGNGSNCTILATSAPLQQATSNTFNLN